MVPCGTQITPANQETMKLLNEVFAGGDEQWQESVKTFVISLFLSDIASSFTIDSILSNSKEKKTAFFQQTSILIEELRGINIVNMDEQLFLSTVSTTVQGLLQIDHNEVMKSAKKCLYHFLICSKKIMDYFQSVLIFYQNAISQHFPNRCGNYKNKLAQSASREINKGGDDSNTHAKDNLSQIDTKMNVGGVGGDIRRGSTIDQQVSGKLINVDESTPSQQKYWKQVIRKVLYQYMYLITPPNGLLSSYLQNNAINFVNLGVGLATGRFNVTGRGAASVSPSRPTPTNYQHLDNDPHNHLRNGLCPLNFQLTLGSLQFLKLVFDLPEKFTKYAFVQEELMLFYIRTHYISFVRLYNKNFSKKQQNVSQLAIESKQRSMTLCKQHLKCLFSISRNRSEDTRRKLYQFKILQFLCQEIELEFECTTAANKQKRNRLLEEAKQQQNMDQINEGEDLPSSTTQGGDCEKTIVIDVESARKNLQNQSNVPMIKVTKATSSQASDSNSSFQQITQEKKSGLPMGLKKLNLSGLAAPSLFSGVDPVEANPPPPQPLAINNQQEPQQQVQVVSNQPPKKKPSFSLNIAGLGHSDLIPDNAAGNMTQIEIDQLKQLAEEQKKAEVVQVPSNRSKREESKRDIPKPQKFIVPKLVGVEKLGLSDLVKDEAPQVQPQEQEENKQEEVKVIEVPQNNPIKRPSFNIPKLPVAGLGLSELKQDNDIGQILQMPQQQNVNKDSQPTQISQGQSQQPSSIPKRPSFSIPKLDMTGLTLSEIIQPTEQNSQANQSNQQPSNQAQALSTIIQDPPQMQQMQQQPKKPLGFNIPPLKVAGLGFSDLKPDLPPPIPYFSQIEALNQNTTQQEEEKREINTLEEEEKKEQPLLQPVQKKGNPFKIPPINVAGLGFSDLKPDIVEPKQQEEQKLNERGLDQREEDKTSGPVIASGQTMLNQPMKKMPISIPKINVEGLGLSELQNDIPKPQQIPQQTQVLIQHEPSNIEPQQPSIKKGLSFAIPPLKVQGLGLSELQNDNSSQIQVAQGPMQNSQIPQQFEEEKEVQQQPLQPLKAKPFIIPKINVAGLGFTDIKPDPNDKQQMPLQQNLEPNNNLISTLGALSTISPNPIQPQQQTIDFSSLGEEGINNNIFRQKEVGMDNYFENTAPMKIFNTDDKREEEKSSPKANNEGQSAPQMERKQSKKIMFVGTRNQNPSDLSFKESLESAQYMNFNKPNTQFESINADIENQQRIIKMRISQQSNATQLRVESILEGGASPQPGLIMNHMTSQGNPTPQNFGSNFLQTPINPMSSGRSLVNQQKDQSKQQNFANSHLKPSMSSSESQVAAPQQQSILKKPLIPSLKIPAKTEQPEGREKIQQQIAYSQSLVGQLEGGDLTKLQKELNKNNVKFQVLIENQKSKQLLSGGGGSLGEIQPRPSFQIVESMLDPNLLQPEPNDLSMMSEDEAFYMKERSMRPIYQDEELHILMLSLIVCLLLTPERGILDDLYCSQYPLDNGKQNVLFLLHHHLNHKSNNQPGLIQKVLTRVHKDVNPPMAGLRLLRLLCTSLFDLKMYNNGKEWRKLAEGAYAKVYEAKTNLSEPQLVAIKQLFLPKSIFDRCVLHDIFTEITCLEELRLEHCVSDLFDYGLDHNSYFIVMKRYSTSLRQWRLEQQKGLNENLGLYLSIYKEFLKSLATIHSHNVTHYDIKCDNVFLDLAPESQNSLSQQFIANLIQDTGAVSSGDDNNRGSKGIRLTIGDFGECKIFTSEKDELCQRNRGTDFCKSPEMLQLTINTRKDTDKYDRRKQVGTNRLSDVWSAGCLLYELLTGEFLFYTPDYLQFHFRVTRPSESLFTPDKLDKINNNVYLIDFMKYMLVRDSRMRPSIENVLKRFEHVHALLVSTTGAQLSTNYRLSLGSGGVGNQQSDSSSFATIQNRSGGVSGFESLLESISALFMSAASVLPPSKASSQVNNEAFFMHILEDVALCNMKWFSKHHKSPLASSFTHLVLVQQQQGKGQKYRDHYEVLMVDNSSSCFMVLPQVLDFIRTVALTRGRVIFVEECQSQIQWILRESLLLSLSHVFQTNAYETYTLIRSQNMFFRVHEQTLSRIALFSQQYSKISQIMSAYPHYSCRCGQCVIILRRMKSSAIDTVTCTCSQYYGGGPQCPSPGCQEFLQFMKSYFNVASQSQSQQPQQQYGETLHWGFIECDDLLQDKGQQDDQPFILGPKGRGNLKLQFRSKSNSKQPSATGLSKKPVSSGQQQQQQSQQSQAKSLVERILASNISQGIDANSTVAAIVDKKTAPGSLAHQGSRKEQQMYSGTGQITRWKLYKCKHCHVWTHAVNDPETKLAVLLNNRMQSTAQVNIRMLNNAETQGSVRVPLLQRLKLKLPF